MAWFSCSNVIFCFPIHPLCDFRQYVGLRTAAKIQIGILFGIAYAMIYLLGMQEIIVDYSPFSTWGLDFIKYQFLIGIGDGIPAFLLCLIISYFTLRNNRQNKAIPTLGLKKSIGVIAILAVAILVEELFSTN